MLALALGGRTKDELKAAMSASEFFEWLAYFSEEPFGEIRADYRNALRMAQLANMFKGKKGRPFKPDDFMPKFGEGGDEPPDGPSLEDIQKFFNSVGQGS